MCELMWHGCKRGDIGGPAMIINLLVIWPGSMVNGVMCQAADTSSLAWLPPRYEHMCELMWHGCKRGGIGGRGNNKSLVSKMASQPDQWSGLPGSRHKLPGGGGRVLRVRVYVWGVGPSSEVRALACPTSTVTLILKS